MAGDVCFVDDVRGLATSFHGAFLLSPTIARLLRSFFFQLPLVVLTNCCCDVRHT